MALNDIVERCQDLYEDLRFGYVREWKAAAPGRHAIGFMPVYVPRELVHAAGARKNAAKPEAALFDRPVVG